MEIPKKVLSKSYALMIKKGFSHFFSLIFLGLLRLATILLPLIFPYLAIFQNLIPIEIALIVMACLYVFIVMPLNFSKAHMLVSAVDLEKNYSHLKIFSLKSYISKFKAGIFLFFLILPWMVPIIVVVSVAIYQFNQPFNQALTFFLTIYGGSTSVGNSLIITGIIIIVFILLAIYGVLRNNLFSLIHLNGESPLATQKNSKNLLKNNRGKQMFIGLGQFILMLPLFIGIILLVYTIVSELYPNNLMLAIKLFSSATGTNEIPLVLFSTPWLKPTLGICFLFSLLLMPFRKLLPAAFLRSLING